MAASEGHERPEYDARTLQDQVSSLREASVQQQEALERTREALAQALEELRELRAATLQQPTSDEVSLAEKLGQSLVDIVNPRLSRYGRSAACRLAVAILALQSSMLFGAAYLNRRASTLTTKLMDYSDVLKVIDRDAGTQAVCATFDDNFTNIVRGHVKFWAGGCSNVSGKPQQLTAGDVWDPLDGNFTACLPTGSVTAYRDEYHRLSLAHDGPRANFPQLQRTIRSAPTTILPHSLEYFSLEFPVHGAEFYYAAAVGRTVVLTPFWADGIGLFDVDTQRFRMHSLEGAVKGGGGKFCGAAVAGRTIVFPPSAADGIGLFDVDAQRFRMHSLEGAVNGSGKFCGAAAVGRTVVLAPYNTDGIGLFDVDAQRFRMHSLEGAVKGWYKFNGALAVGRTVVLVPYNADGIGLFDVDAQRFRMHSLEGAVKGGGKFCDGAVVGRTVVFVPCKADGIGLFDVDARRFQMYSLGGAVQGKYKFCGAAAVGRTVVLAPFDADGIGFFDVDTRRFWMTPLEGAVKGSKKFCGAAAVGRSAILVPYHAEGVVMLGGPVVEIEWLAEDQQVLSELRDSREGRAAPCRIAGRNCSQYHCFGTKQPTCKQSKECRAPTVNATLALRVSWLNALLMAMSQTVYYEMAATAILLGAYLIYWRVCRSTSLAGGFTQVVFEGDSSAELRRLRSGA